MAKERKGLVDNNINKSDIKETQNKTSETKAHNKTNDGSSNVIIPTSEQLRMAKLISRHDQINDDPAQNEKIQLVMNITQKAEVAVATALFDAGWDTNLAIGILLEGGEQLLEWEETRKNPKKKPQKSAATEDKKIQGPQDECQKQRGIQNDGQPWSKNSNTGDVSRQEVPPRMRRGGNVYQANRGRRGPRLANENEIKTESNLSTNSPDKQAHNNYRDSSMRQGTRDIPWRGRGQGRRGRGANRYFQRERRDIEPSEGFTSNSAEPVSKTEGLETDDYVVGYSGNIESWNPRHSNEHKSGGEGLLASEEKKSDPQNESVKEIRKTSSWANECIDGIEAAEEQNCPTKFNSGVDSYSSKESKSSHLFRELPEHQIRQNENRGTKEPIDNARNWMKSSPVTDVWDHEEYTGSLANTKVFTATSTTRIQPISERIHHNLEDQNFQRINVTKPQQPPFGGISVSSYKTASSIADPKLDQIITSEMQPTLVSNNFQRTQANKGQHDLFAEIDQNSYKNTNDCSQKLNQIMSAQTRLTGSLGDNNLLAQRQTFCRNENSEKSPSKTEIKRAQTVSPHQPPGFSAHNYNIDNSLATSAINKMLLGQAPPNFQQVPQNYLPSKQQSMLSPLWLTPPGQMHSSGVHQPTDLVQEQIEPSLSVKAVTENFISSMDLKDRSNISPFDRKTVQKEVETMSSISEHVPTSSFGPRLDLRQPSVSHVSNINPTQEIQRETIYSRARLPPLSKIPNSAVEMPGDFSTRLDIQFGNLDLPASHSNKADNLGLIDSNLFSLSRSQNQFLGANMSGQTGSYVTSVAHPSASQNQYANQYNQLGALYASLATPPSRGQNQYQSANNIPQSGSYLSTLSQSNAQNQYVSLNPSNQVGSSATPPSRGQTQHPATNTLNQPSYVPSVPSNAINQYMSPNKPDQARPYGNSVASAPSNNQYVDAASNNQSQYVGAPSNNPSQYVGPASNNPSQYVGPASNNPGQYVGPASNNPHQYVSPSSNNPNQYIGQMPAYASWVDGQRDQPCYYVDPNAMNYLGYYNCPN